MKKIFVLAVVLAIMWVVPAVSAESNVPDGVSGTEATTYDVTLPGSFYVFGVLSATVPTDYDTYNLHVTSATTVTADIVDCCIMGDTIAFGIGPSAYLKATSPATIHVSKRLPVGNYKLYVGYIAGPGGFPAGYVATFSG